MLSNLWKTYATDVVFAETEIDIQNSHQPSTKLPNEYAQVFWSKALRCHQKYTKYTLKAIIVKDLSGLICSSMQTYWIAYDNSTWQNLGRYAASLGSSQGATYSNHKLNQKSLPAQNNRRTVQLKRYLGSVPPIGQQNKKMEKEKVQVESTGHQRQSVLRKASRSQDQQWLLIDIWRGMIRPAMQQSAYLQQVRAIRY